MPTPIFNSEQRNFIIGCTLKKYHHKVLNGKFIEQGREDKYIDILFSLDEDEKNIPLLDQDKKHPMLQSYLDKEGKVLYTGRENDDMCLGLNSDIEENISSILSELPSWKEKLNQTNPSKNFRRFIHEKTNAKVLIITFIIYILVDKNIIDIKELKKFPLLPYTNILNYLKSLLKRKYDDFPPDIIIPKQIILGKYNIVIIGDNKEDTRYKKIEAQFSEWRHDIEPRFINISSKHEFTGFFINQKSTNVIGVFLLLSNEFFTNSYENRTVAEIILHWAKSNNSIPITYTLTHEVRNNYLDNFEELGKPIKIASNNGTGIISVFVQAINRYKDTEGLFFASEKENKRLKREKSSIQTAKDSLESQLQKTNQELKNKRRINKILISLCLLFLSFMLIGINKYKKLNDKNITISDNYNNLTKDDTSPFLTIKNAPSSSDEKFTITPYYLKIDNLLNNLYVSNKRNSALNFARIPLSDINESKDSTLIYDTNMKISFEKPSLDFDFLDVNNKRFILVSTDSDKTLDLVEIIGNHTNEQWSLSTTDGKNTASASDDIAVSVNLKYAYAVVTNWQSDYITVFKNLSIEKPKIVSNRILVKKDKTNISFSNPSGVSFIDSTLIVVCLNTENEKEDKIFLIDINTGVIKDTEQPPFSHRKLNDIEVANQTIIACSDWDAKVYGLTHFNNKLIPNKGIIEFYGEGSPTDIEISPNKKWAFVSHQNHKRFDLISIEKFGGINDKIAKTYKFGRATTEKRFKCEGLAVDWKNRIVFIPNLVESEIYCFKIDDYGFDK